MVAPNREALRRLLERRQQATAQRLDRGERTAPQELRDFLRRRLVDGARPRATVALPDGDECATARGACWRRQLRYPLDHRHGDAPLGDALRVDPGRLATLAKADVFAAVRAEQFLFLDTETTGLAGGAGTVVFALGLGWFEGDAFVLEQLFLRDFGEEPAMLLRTAELLARHPVPVTFVGKSFDRHRIAARLAVCRVDAPILTERHLDLYHLARRAWGKQLPDCRLRTIEEELLGLRRDDDLPGSEAPLAFLDWIRDGTGAVDRVLEHNRLDVLALAALLGVLGAAR